MENTNYSQMFNAAQSEETAPTQPEQPIRPAKRFGRVASCEKLNVRTEADVKSEILKIIDVGTRVKIIDDQNEDFYKVTIKRAKDEFLTGYCMKKYIDEEK